MKKWTEWIPWAALAFSALLLCAVSAGLRGVSTHSAAAERLAQMQLLLPGNEKFTELAYDGADENIERVFRGESGYVIETRVNGYVAPIDMRIGVDVAGRITGLQILDINETRGLGFRALRDADFLSQFLNRRGEMAVGEDVDALSGATVTSRTIARSVNSASAYVTGVDTVSGATAWGG